MLRGGKKYLLDRRLWTWLAVAYFLITYFPGLPGPLSAGLDPSWQFALNYLVGSEYIAGKDVTFTYGPLGYLLSPLDIGSNLATSMLLWFSVRIAVAGFLARIGATAPWPPAILLSAVLLACARAIGLGPEKLIQLLLGLLLCECIAGGQLVRVMAIAAGVIAGFLPFMKITLGITGAAMLATFLAVVAWDSGRKGWRSPASKGAVLAVVTVMATWAALAAVLFGSIGNLAGWLRISSELVDGYSIAMTIIGPTRDLVLGVAGLFLYGVATLIILWRRSGLLYPLLVFLPALLLAFKQGFVRQDDHVLSYFAFLVGVAAALVLYSRTKLDRAIAGIAALASVALAIPVTARNLAPAPPPPMWETLSGRRGISSFLSFLNLSAERERIAAVSRDQLRADTLPRSWVSAIKQAGGGVGVLPHEILYCPANRLAWRPAPVMQAYAIYTSYLDQISADHYSADRGPAFIIFDFTGIDMRHPLYDMPAGWRSIMQHYDPVAADAPSARLLLRHREQARSMRLTTVRNERFLKDDWVSVPDSDAPLFIAMDMRLTLAGRLVKTAFRLPPVGVQLRHASGNMSKIRFAPDVACNGLPISCVPMDVDELVRLFNLQCGDRVRSFKLFGPGLSYYERQIAATWRELR
ncbi:MAG: hypothetical protein HYX75_18750 [Acidobacteria bacterium]|nr:hypothetical protein [Acidobacteriota bacterium]